MSEIEKPSPGRHMGAPTPIYDAVQMLRYALEKARARPDECVITLPRSDFTHLIIALKQETSPAFMDRSLPADWVDEADICGMKFRVDDRS